MTDDKKEEKKKKRFFYCELSDDVFILMQQLREEHNATRKEIVETAIRQYAGEEAQAQPLKSDAAMLAAIRRILTGESK